MKHPGILIAAALYGSLSLQAAQVSNNADYNETTVSGANLDLSDDWWINCPDVSTPTFAAKNGTGITLTAQGGGEVNTGDRTDHTYLWSSGSANVDNPSAPAAHNTNDYRIREYSIGLLGEAPSLDLTKGAYYSVDITAGNTSLKRVIVYGMARRNDEIYLEAVLRNGAKTITRTTLSPSLLGTQPDTATPRSFTFSFDFQADDPTDILSFTIAGYNDAETTDRSLAIDAVTVKTVITGQAPRFVDSEVVGDSLKLVIDAPGPLKDLMLLRNDALTTPRWDLTTYSTSPSAPYLHTDLSSAVSKNGFYEVYVPRIQAKGFFSIDPTPQSEWYEVARNSMSRITTHDLVSGDMTVGVSDTGGGYINRIILPGRGDIMGPQADQYGRGGQSAIRDRLHSLVYNPTQGGFHDNAGTVCRIVAAPDESALIVAPRPCTLFRGDGQFDYTEWENLVTDRYNSDGGNTDEDGIDESSLEGQQATEITSEFDFFATYENVLGSSGSSFNNSDEISIPAVRHYYEYRYIRDPGHCISQFNQGEYDPYTGDVTDISVAFPSGVHPDNPNDLGAAIFSISIRIDRDIWTPTHIGLVDGSTINDLSMGLRPPTDTGNKGLTLRDFHRNNALVARVPNAPNGTQPTVEVPLFILADSNDIDAPGALGLYYPDSNTNEFSVIGVNRQTGAIEYEDDRRMQTDLRDVAFRTPEMSWCGFRGTLTGMLNPTRLPASQYEAMRGEYYLLYGTPRQIFENAQRIQPF